MKQGTLLLGVVVMLSAQVALAQTPAPQDTTASTIAQAPPPVATPPPPPPPPPAPATNPTSQFYRFGSISGSWLMPSGDFDNIAGDGWAITLEGYQFIDPTKRIAFGTQIGYQAFGEKNGVTVSNFPVDAVLKFYPKPGSGRLDFFVTGGLGFNYTRVEVFNVSDSDYFFGTQAGAGVNIHGKGPVGFIVDATYHWIYATGTDPNFIAWRGGLTIPLMSK
jgi:hypothetical protein